MNQDDDRYIAAALVGGILLVVAIALGMVLLWAAPARGHSNPWLLTWIPAYCCVTNDCCREVTEYDVTSLPDDYWRINASGQILKRTGNTPDGKWYRCYCDYDSQQGKWIVHPKAQTRCLFTPDFGS